MDTKTSTQMTPEELEALLASPECAALIAVWVDVVRAIVARQSALAGEADEAPHEREVRSRAATHEAHPRKPAKK